MGPWTSSLHIYVFFSEHNFEILRCFLDALASLKPVVSLTDRTFSDCQDTTESISRNEIGLYQCLMSNVKWQMANGKWQMANGKSEELLRYQLC